MSEGERASGDSDQDAAELPPDVRQQLATAVVPPGRADSIVSDAGSVERGSLPSSIQVASIGEFILEKSPDPDEDAEDGPAVLPGDAHPATAATGKEAVVTTMTKLPPGLIIPAKFIPLCADREQHLPQRKPLTAADVTKIPDRNAEMAALEKKLLLKKLQAGCGLDTPEETDKEAVRQRERSARVLDLPDTQDRMKYVEEYLEKSLAAPVVPPAPSVSAGKSDLEASALSEDSDVEEAAKPALSETENKRLVAEFAQFMESVPAAVANITNTVADGNLQQNNHLPLPLPNPSVTGGGLENAADESFGWGSNQAIPMDLQSLGSSNDIPPMRPPSALSANKKAAIVNCNSGKATPSPLKKRLLVAAGRDAAALLHSKTAAALAKTPDTLLPKITVAPAPATGDVLSHPCVGSSRYRGLSGSSASISADLISSNDDTSAASGIGFQSGQVASLAHASNPPKLAIPVAVARAVISQASGAEVSPRPKPKKNHHAAGPAPIIGVSAGRRPLAPVLPVQQQTIAGASSASGSSKKRSHHKHNDKKSTTSNVIPGSTVGVSRFSSVPNKFSTATHAGGGTVVRNVAVVHPEPQQQHQMPQPVAQLPPAVTVPTTAAATLPSEPAAPPGDQEQLQAQLKRLEKQATENMLTMISQLKSALGQAESKIITTSGGAALGNAALAVTAPAPPHSAVVMAQPAPMAATARVHQEQPTEIALTAADKKFSKRFRHHKAKKQQAAVAPTHHLLMNTAGLPTLPDIPLPADCFAGSAPAAMSNGAAMAFVEGQVFGHRLPPGYPGAGGPMVPGGNMATPNVGSGDFTMGSGVQQAGFPDASMGPAPVGTTMDDGVGSPTAADLDLDLTSSPEMDEEPDPLPPPPPPKKAAGGGALATSPALLSTTGAPGEYGFHHHSFVASGVPGPIAITADPRSGGYVTVATYRTVPPPTRPQPAVTAPRHHASSKPGGTSFAPPALPMTIPRQVRLI